MTMFKPPSPPHAPTSALTPTLIDAKQTPTASVAATAVLRFCKARQKGCATNDPWQHFSINPLQYAEFESFARSDSALWGYLEDKLR